MPAIVPLDKKIREIEKRNIRVEQDKAWETSKFRIICIIVITYVVSAIIFGLLGISERYLIDALIPTAAFFLSTRSLVFLKGWWIRRYFKGLPQK